MNLYSAYGLHIASDIALPELSVTSDAAIPVDVHIRRGRLPSMLADAPECGLGVAVTDASIHLEWTEVGTFSVREGREIIVSPREGVSEEIVRLPLLGVVLGALLHQRGKITLHASAVSVGGVAAAFVGQKGAGKSTMAAAMQRRGHALLTDDVLAIDPETYRVESAFPQLKLRGDAADALQADPGTLARLAPDLDKYALRHVTFDASSHPLGAVFVLEEGESLQCTPLDGMNAFLTLMGQGYASRFLGTEGTRSSDLRHHTALAAAVPVVQLQRPRDLSRLPAVCAAVEAFVETRTFREAGSPQTGTEMGSIA